jgi:hypothetical protein
MFAMLASAPAPMPIAAAYARAPDWQGGFCRNADPLPRLDPETTSRPQQVNGGGKASGKDYRTGVIAPATSFAAS